MDTLPIDVVVPRIVDALRTASALVLEAPPGAGKTTRVPAALLDAGIAGTGEVVVLEPRRLATRLAARRVAEERGERLGDTVGYQVRFEDVSSPRTRLRYVTEGVLTRRLLGDPLLRGVGAVVLDEFHERHLQGDVALALLRRLQQTTRADLKLVAMSATLDAAPVADFLGGAPRVRSEGKRYDVAIEHATRPDDRPLAVQVASAVRSLVEGGLDGDVLVFLPGAGEIRKARDACTAIASTADLLVVALHGDMPPAEQDRAVARASRRKVILSTNVAETSVTIDGVVAVIDSGLARMAGHAPWSGLPTLKVGRISRASATQRAGRAGRTRPGRCVRLYTRHDHDTRPDHDLPEVARMDLTETALELHAAGVRDLRAFGWFEAPTGAALDAAEAVLRALGAVDDQGAVTPTGAAMLRFPVHPRLGRLLVEAARRDVVDGGCVVAALLSERDIVAERRVQGLGEGRSYGGMTSRRDVTGTSDVGALADRFIAVGGHGFDPEAIRAEGLDVGAVQAVERVRKQLHRVTSRADTRADTRGASPTGGGVTDAESALRMAILAGYPDRVARRLRGQELVLVTGGTAVLAEASEVRTAEFMVAVDAEERTEGRGRGVTVRSACAIEPEWLLEMFPEAIRDVAEARWVAEDERADVVTRLQFGPLTLDESRAARTPEAIAAASRVLADAAVAKGARSFAEDDAVDRWVARVGFAAGCDPAAGIAVPDESLVNQVLRELCAGRRSFAELRAAGLMDALRARLTGGQRAAVEALAPERVTLPGGRGVRVNYERGQKPWIASRLQDFFGMTVGPSVGRGTVPLVLHLLAPNQRAVQVTTDLAGFWARHYAGIRRELCRKYPRQPWPEDGRTATPPPPTAGRRR